MRGRGLKLVTLEQFTKIWESPLMRGRGLKPRFVRGHNISQSVAPHAGAWIETVRIVGYNTYSMGRPSCGGVD